MQKAILNKILKVSVFLPVFLQIRRHDEMWTSPFYLKFIRPARGKFVRAHLALDPKKFADP